MEIRPHHWLVALTLAGAAHGSLLLTLPTDTPTKPAPKPVYRIHLATAEAPGRGVGTSLVGDAGPISTLAPLASASPALMPLSAPAEALKARTLEPDVPKPKPKAARKEPRETAKQSVKDQYKARTTEARRRAAAKPTTEARPDRDDTGTVATARSSGASQGTRSDHASAGREGVGSGRGAGTGSAGKGSGAASARSYSSTLAAWLARHKRYPAQARRRQEQGTVRVTFTIDRQGRLLSHRIAASSGHPLLDQEVKAMVQRASPMPPIPAALGKSRLTITVPISFRLR